MISDSLAVIDSAIATHSSTRYPVRSVYSMFSGGHDSLAATAIAARHPRPLRFFVKRYIPHPERTVLVSGRRVLESSRRRRSVVPHERPPLCTSCVSRRLSAQQSPGPA